MRKIILTSLVVFLGCTATVRPKKWEQPKLQIDDPKPIELQPVSFLVIHRDNAESVFLEMEAKGDEPVLIALSGKDYKNLSVNMQILKNYLLEQKKIIKLYKEFYEKQEKK